MPLTILATSDLHLGMKFAGLPDVQAVLAEARFACLERLVATANARRVDLLLVAGDLFHQVTVAKRDVLRAAQALRAFEGRLAAVLPGNHDHLSPGQDSAVARVPRGRAATGCWCSTSPGRIPWPTTTSTPACTPGRAG